MKKDRLEELFTSDLRYVINMEKQIIKALTKISKAAVLPELKQIFDEQLKQGSDHINRVESMFDDIGQKSRGIKSKGLEGIVQESAELIDKSGKLEPDVLDAALIATVQRIQQYKIAAYKTLRIYSRFLESQYSSALLDKTLDEESLIYSKLTRVLTNRVNPKTK